MLTAERKSLAAERIILTVQLKRLKNAGIHL
jgi:hypothetical protein